MSKELEVIKLETDILIIGGGTAGCYAALTVARESNLKVMVLEKANIKRSGCLAAGVNAINAYITKKITPEDYMNYALVDSENIAREDLLITMAKGLNKVVSDLENLGLVILKDESGEYQSRGNRNIKINGENIKPILAAAVKSKKQITVMNKINVIDYEVYNNEVKGAYAISVEKNILYFIKAKKIICATGGASGLYKPNNEGFSRHKMWYSPFNTGAGYAMGIRAGAEMTTFEMRFIALRCKDTIAPTGTLAQGALAKQINAKGEVYEKKYGITTSQRLYGTIKENIEGRGPCYLQTKGLSKEEDINLMKAYLNMAPSQTLKWIEEEKKPSDENVEIEGTEPYIVGGHTASGYWVSTNRETTIKGLYAVGDVAGGCPQKYVSGAMVEGEIAAKSAIKEIQNSKQINTININNNIEVKAEEVERLIGKNDYIYSIEELEEAMQKVMDNYAGGIKSNYQYTMSGLLKAEMKIQEIINLVHNLKGENMREVVSIYELKDRLLISKALIAHLKARKETRWHSFGENLDFPKRDSNYDKYINSIFIDGRFEIIYRKLVKKEEIYEHKDK